MKLSATAASAVRSGSVNVAATEADWPAEYLDAVIAMRVVGGIEEAMAHIARYGSQICQIKASLLPVIRPGLRGYGH